MLKALIIDDEPLAHRIIERYTADIPFLEIVGQCYFATEAYAELEASQVDLIFLDIQMPKLKGLDFLRTLTQPPNIIVTTAFEEYAIEGYELQVADYLLKPFSFDRFLKAVNIVRNAVFQNSQSGEKNIMLFVKVDKRQTQIFSGEIYCLESYGNYVKIWMEKEMFLTSRTLNSFEEELSSHYFQRIHKSFIVNRNFVNFVEGNSVHLKNKMSIPVGKNHRQAVRDWYQKS